MKSSWMPVGDGSKIERGKLKERIFELIKWYDENSTCKEDGYIRANLRLIADLVENVEGSEDIIFIEKIVETFLDIIKKQRELIMASETGTPAVIQGLGQQLSSIAAFGDGFLNDERIKASFTEYMQRAGKSPFTTNDYILRVQNLWRSFYSDLEKGNLPLELAESVVKDEIKADSPLLNAYRYIEELNCYVSMRIAGDSQNRNWFNIRAALNIFGEALHGDEYEKVKVVRDASHGKDFSKYVFDGETYGKSRLVLAVVRRYVREHNPATFGELESVFPAHLQGSLGVVRRIDDVSEKYKGVGGVKRYFLNDDEIIRLPSGERVIVCTQFGAANTERFVKHAIGELGYEIRKTVV